MLRRGKYSVADLPLLVLCSAFYVPYASSVLVSPSGWPVT